MKVAVIGVGNLGQHHVRVYNEIEEVDSVFAVDIDKEKLERISKKFKVKVSNDYRDVIGEVDAASIVTPTPSHYEITKELLLGGIHCMVEKPMVTELTHADELIEIAKDKNLILQVGHVERFNPVIHEAQKYIKEPKYIESYRLGPYDTKVKDVSVVLDLMIHDLDVVLALIQDEIVSIDAFGAKVLSEHEDMVKVRIKFKNGCVADFAASRLTKARYRKIRIFQPDAYISLDYPTQRLKIMRKKTDHVKSMDDIEVIIPKIEKHEPLKKELIHFINCVKNNEKPLIDGETAKRILKIGLDIQQCLLDSSL